MPKEWTAAEEKFLQSYYVSHGMNYCCEALDREPASIRHKASRLGLKRRGEGREARMVEVGGYPALSAYNDRQRMHRKIVEENLGRTLRPDEIVHHKDEDKTNYGLDNLEVVSRSEHMKIHNVNRPRNSKGQFIS